jgi:hypothetical protein
LQITVCFIANQRAVYRRNLIVTISVEAWDKLEDPDTQKWLPTKWVPLRTILQDFPLFKKVEGLLAEVQADWEELKETLCPIEAVGRYNRLLTWPSAKTTGGVVSSQRRRKLTKSPHSSP